MPRNRPVDYPQVHPPTAQAYVGLAPPPNVFNDEPRFSWQDSSSPEAISPSRAAEKQLEAGISGRTQEQRRSSVPPLPVLPDHLNASEPRDGQYQSSTQEKQEYESQGDNQSTPRVKSVFAQQYYQDHKQPEQEPIPFRPDIPRHFQQQEAPIQLHQEQQRDHDSPPLGPPLSYEASQAQTVSQQPYYTQLRMQEHPLYPGHHDVASSALTAHALPMRHDYQPTIVNHPIPELDNEAQTPVRTDGLNQTNHLLHPIQAVPRVVEPRSQTSRAIPINISPDANPLTPTSPNLTQTPTSPNYHHSLPPHNHSNNDPNDAPLSFPQATSYTPPGPTRGGTWQTSLFSCSSPTICLPSLFCPCIIYGRTQYRLSQRSAKKDPTNMLGYNVINGSCLAWSVLCGVNVLLTAVQHTRVRKMYEMEEGSGGLASDCVKSLCCCCCVVAVDEREVKFREERGVGGVGGGEKGYRRNEGMVYSPPPR